MSEEVRVTSSTGGQKGKKLERYDLIPVGPLAHVARVYGKGAEKYTKYGECDCALAVSPSTQKECVDAATTKTSSDGTLSTLKNNDRTIESGQRAQKTWSEKSEWISTANATRDHEHTGPTGLQEKNTTPILPPRVESAVPPQSISITTTPAVPLGRGVGSAFEEDSATDATSDAGTLKAGSQNTKKQHEPGCPALTVVQTGDNNWRKGYDWSLSYAALQRHMNRFWGGEWLDPETGVPHLACAVFHAFALMEFYETHPEFDDRPLGKPAATCSDDECPCWLRFQ